MMCIISDERIVFCGLVKGTLVVVFAESPITLQSRCKRVPNEPIPTHGYSWPSTPECSFKIGDRQSEKKRWNCDGRAICNTTLGIGAGHGVSLHRDISDSSDGPRPLWQSHSARTELFFADLPWGVILIRILSEALIILLFISLEVTKSFYWLGLRVNLPVLQ